MSSKLTLEQACSLLRKTSKEFEDAWRFDPRYDLNRPLPAEFAQSEILSMVQHYRKNDYDPIASIINQSKCRHKTHDRIHCEFLEQASSLHERLDDTISMRSLEAGAALMFDKENLVRLPMFALCLREIINNWLNKSAPKALVEAAGFYQKNHPRSKQIKLQPNRADQLIYTAVRGMPLEHYLHFVDQQYISSEAKRFTALYNGINRAVHFNTETLEFGESCTKTAIILINDCISIMDFRSRMARKLGRALLERLADKIWPELSLDIDNAFEAAGLEPGSDNYIHSVEAKCYKGGVSIDIIGASCSSEIDYHFPDIHYMFSYHIGYDDMRVLAGRGNSKHGNNNYHCRPDRLASTTKSALDNYLLSSRADEDGSSRWSKFIMGTEESLSVDFT